MGIDPFDGVSVHLAAREKEKRTPTALPRKNRATQSVGNVVANEAAMPKRDVKNRVALKAVLRPTRSEP